MNKRLPVPFDPNAAKVQPYGPPRSGLGATLTRWQLDANRRALDARAALIRSAELNYTAQSALARAYLGAAKAAAEVSDLPAILAEDQATREHARLLAEGDRNHERETQVRSAELAQLHHRRAVSQAEAKVVLAKRNHRAAETIADVEIERWLARAEAARFEATGNRTATEHDAWNAKRGLEQERGRESRTDDQSILADLRRRLAAAEDRGEAAEAERLRAAIAAYSVS